MISFNSVKAPPLEKTADQLAVSLPEGRAWNAKTIPGTLMRSLIVGCAAEFNLVQQQIERMAREFNINLSVDLLPEWEASVGLPDSCQIVVDNLVGRRQAVIDRIKKIPIVTVADFEALILSLTGKTATVVPAAPFESFTFSWPITLSTSSPLFKLYIIVDDATEGGFTYNFPVVFGSTVNGLIRCVLEQIIPANVVLIIR
jgi:uncharacterized protein YmfQ (DUF2313 family)